MDMVDILKKYLKAERLGDWDMHLAATTEMLPYFAASGHNHYLKSSYIYVQQMHELEQLIQMSTTTFQMASLWSGEVNGSGVEFQQTRSLNNA